jgi:hypothetical protein
MRRDFFCNIAPIAKGMPIINKDPTNHIKAKEMGIDQGLLATTNNKKS